MSRATFETFYKLNSAPTPPESDEETSSATSESFSFSRTIPWDIMCAIIARLDFTTLQVMSLVAQDHHQECAKYLWKNFTISVGKVYQATEEAARKHIDQSAAALFSREHTKWLRGLDIYIGTTLGRENNPLVEASIQQISTLLQKATGLQQLEFSAYHHQPRFLRLFSTINFAPNLSQFSSRFGSFRVGNALDMFWRTHPNLQSVEWDGHGGLPTAHLPLLHTLHIQFGHQATILQGNPVRDLHIYALLDRDCSTLMENIRASPSQGTMVLLTANLCDNPATAFAYTVVLKHLPNLRNIRLIHVTMPDKADRDKALHVLSTLSRLEVVEWGANNFQLPEEEYDDVKDDFFRACSHSCQHLRKATLHLYEDYPLVFVRESLRSPWVRKPYEVPQD